MMLKMSELAPIVFFCYNRADLTKIVLEKLAENFLASESELFIFSDGPKNEVDIEKVNAVRNVIKKITGFKKVHIEEKKVNLGLSKSIISGVSKIINEYGKVIVIEDDIVTSKYFLEFMNDSLNFYENDKKVFSITGFTQIKGDPPSSYKNDVYLFPYRFSAWGWGTWKDRWNRIDFEIKDFDSFKKDLKKREEFAIGGRDLFDMLELRAEGKLDSWGILACYSQFKNRAYTLIPTRSLVNNIGSGLGIHGGPINYPQHNLDENYKKKPNLIKSSEILKTNHIMVKRHIEALNEILKEALILQPTWKKTLKKKMKKILKKIFGNRIIIFKNLNRK